MEMAGELPVRVVTELGAEEIFFSPLKLNAGTFKWYHWCWGCLVFALGLLELILSLLLVSSVGGWL